MKIERFGDTLLLGTENEDETMILAAFIPGGSGQLVIGEPTATRGLPALSITRYTGCAAKAIITKQPAFTLIAQDKLSAPLVELWADLAGLHGCTLEKVVDARNKARAMRAWPTQKFPD